MAGIAMRAPTHVLLVLILLFSVHMLEIGVFAIIYVIAERGLGLGSFAGEPVKAALDYYYFSATTYTSLGIGDISPTGHLRFLAGVQGLNGLLLIAWSASFLYAMMVRLWVWKPCASPAGPPLDTYGQSPAAQRQQGDTGAVGDTGRKT